MLSLIPVPAAFPVVTFFINIMGALLIGFLTGLSEDGSWSGSRRLVFLKTGVCGGFTTFSTFSLETVTLWEAGAQWSAAGYAVFSVVLCLAGVLVGRWLGRMALLRIERSV